MIAFALLLAQVGLPPPAPVGTAASGIQEIYARKCVLCHAEDGTGNTKKGKQLRVPDFTSAKWQNHTRDDEIIEIIEKGNQKRKMPAFQDKLTPEQIQALVPYLRGFAKK